MASAPAPAPPIHRESTAVAVDSGTSWLSLPTDALAEILLRLPPSRRRWARLVCRDWRAVIDERTPRPSKPAVLACFTSDTFASAYVVDDLATGLCGREVWRVDAKPDAEGRRYMDVTVIGTCNGLLCVCDNTKPGGAVALLNPATGEAPLRVPPLPISARRGLRWGRDSGCGKAYSFGFDAMTGQYKLLHLPCRFDASASFNVVQVFMLGDPSWRDVPVSSSSSSSPDGGASATSCSLDAGLVSVDGATCWVTKPADSVVAFDLRDERVAFAAPLPSVGGGRRTSTGYLFRLTEVRGRLGLAVSADRRAPGKTEVWVLGDGRQGRCWSRQYSVQMQAEVWQRLAGPHFAHDGYVLTVRFEEWGREHLVAHRMRDAGRLLSLVGEVRSMRIRDQGTVVAYCKNGYYLRTFAYVETTEPLSVYKPHHRTRQKIHTKLHS